MTNEERDIIARFIARVGGAGAPSGFGSVPNAAPAAPPSLPPVDPEADAFIRDQFGSHPEAPYRITQMAFVQEAALTEAQSRIQRLQWELNQARQQAVQSQPPSRGFLGGLFGGGQQQSGPQQQYQSPPPPPPPQYAPGMAQPSMFQQGGSGFLGSALTTAAGVAGGMVVGNAIMDMFSPHAGLGGGFGAGGFGGGGFGGGLAGAPGETVVNNYYGNNPSTPDPWGGAGVAAPDQDNGFWSKDDVYGNASPAEPPQADPGQASPADPGWGADSDFGGSTNGTSGAGGDDGWT